MHMDEWGYPYVEFSSPARGKTRRYNFMKHGYTLKKEIKTFSGEEQLRWQKRVTIRAND